MVGKKLISVIMAALMVSSVLLAGCSDNSAEKDSANSTSGVLTVGEESETTLSDELPEENFEGYEFRMLIRNDKGWIEDMYAEALDADIMNDAIFNRNATVSERFNVSFKVIPSSNGNVETDGVKTITSGDDAYDIIIPHARASFVYALQNLIVDWNSDALEYVDLDKPWWDQAVRENLSVNNKLFMMTGDISYKNFGATNAMLFNKGILEDLNLDYPYQLVNDNKWTFDKFTEYAKQGTDDLNGDGKIAFADDRLGYVTDEWIGPIQVLYSGNQKIVQKDEDDVPYLSLNTEMTVSVFEKFFALIDSDDAHCAPWEGLDTSTASATGIYGRFTRNQAMFLDTNIRGVIFLRDMDTNFGIVPWPKFNENIDKYYSNVDAGCNIIIVPITNQVMSLTSIILEALAAEGYKTVIPAYFDVALSTKYSRDDESAEMLNYLKEARVYDLGYYDMNNPLNSIGKEMFSTKNRDFTSLYKKHEKAANKQIEKTIDAYNKG